MNDLNETITEDSQASLIRTIWFQRKSSRLIKRPNYGHMVFLSIEIHVLVLYYTVYKPFIWQLYFLILNRLWIV